MLTHLFAFRGLTVTSVRKPDYLDSQSRITWTVKRRWNGAQVLPEHCPSVTGTVSKCFWNRVRVLAGGFFQVRWPLKSA